MVSIRGTRALTIRAGWRAELAGDPAVLRALRRTPPVGRRVCIGTATTVHGTVADGAATAVGG